MRRAEYRSHTSRRNGLQSGIFRETNSSKSIVPQLAVTIDFQAPAVGGIHITTAELVKVVPSGVTALMSFWMENFGHRHHPIHPKTQLKYCRKCQFHTGIKSFAMRFR
ncbi:MAG: hypothetical protein ACJAWM_001903 [Sulfitobacter sp.]|uniref:hypothetical protein n=1 Tax=Sulfitobacter sp. TaxID=1903071 RepID=UPI0039E4E064